MEATVTSLFWISLVAVASPLLAGFVPRRLVSEVVLLLAFGILIGPYGLELAAMDAPIDLLRELGLAFLFLLAGFEVELRELTGRAGGTAALTWLGCLLLALGVVALLGVTEVLDAEIAVAIARPAGRPDGRPVLTRAGGQPVVAYVSAARLSNS